LPPGTALKFAHWKRVILLFYATALSGGFVAWVVVYSLDPRENSLPWLFLIVHPILVGLFSGGVMILIHCVFRLRRIVGEYRGTSRCSEKSIFVPNVLALGLYFFSVVGLAGIHQIFPGRFWFLGYSPVLCIFFLSPLPVVALLASVCRSFRKILFSEIMICSPGARHQ